MKPEKPVQTKAPIACAFLLSALASAGCQDLNALVTGDPFFAAREDVPRVEVELVVDVEDSVFESFDARHRSELEETITDEVLSLADVGMRFYPVPSSDYGEGDAHPARLMVVRIEDLVVRTEEETVEEEGSDPRVESFVSGVECSASASLEKRRESAPPLLVAEDHGESRVGVRAGRETEAEEARDSFPLSGDQSGEEPLRVPREKVARAVEKAVVTALRGLMAPVDRDLRAEGEGERTP